MLWKAWNGRSLYESEGGIRVFDNFFYRTLKFNSSPYQTVINLYDPQKACLHYINALGFMVMQHPGNCLLLGLGGGGVAHALSTSLGAFSITAVEINNEVIDISKKYFMINRLPNLQIIQADANDFVKAEGSFKHILIDLFDAERFPPSCGNELFFANCKNLLSPDGFLAINLANPQEKRPIFEILKKQFSSSLVAIPIKKCANMVIVASADESKALLLNSFRTSSLLKSLSWNSYWGSVAVLNI